MNKYLQNLRPPHVAGSFYPSREKLLKTELLHYLNQAKLLPENKLLKVLIVPHAGIIYSGLTAAWGFKQIERQKYHKIILLGVSHHSSLPYAAVFPRGSWQTPLGTVSVDNELATLIIDNRQNIIADDQVHLREHSLEMELIFLQVVLSDFKIIPILISCPDKQLIDNLSSRISENITQDTLIIISSDLSHYPEYETANKIDKETITAILTGKIEQFTKILKDDKANIYPNLFTRACGQEAIKIALKVAGKLNLNHLQLLKYENSGDRGKDKNQVVGYASIGIYGENE